MGSSNYITNFAGEVSQHSEYFAFGETFIEEHLNSHNSPYKYNGKELDEESGLYYYGARYYDPRISIWASVDPLAEMFPVMSPYNYCFNNPINLTDPSGMAPEGDDNKPPKAGVNDGDTYTVDGDTFTWNKKGNSWDLTNRELKEVVVTGQKKLPEELVDPNMTAGEYYGKNDGSTINIITDGTTDFEVFTDKELQNNEDVKLLMTIGMLGLDISGQATSRMSLSTNKRYGFRGITSEWDVLPTNNKFDKGAHDLAAEIGGIAQARFRNNTREYDAISTKYIGQHKPALQDNIGKSFKNQARATFDAAKKTGRGVYYKFDGKPGQKVFDKLNQYSSEYGVPVTIKY